MLDGLKRDWAEPLRRSLAKPLAKAGFTPNQVTLLGLALVLLNCAFFVWHQNTFWFGLGIGVSFAFDALDGAVARLRNMSSKFGGYLDGVVDRYQEIAVYAAIGWVTGWWALVFLTLTGSLMVSYNKARTAIEIPIKNHAWPDLLERFERVVILSLALLLDSILTLPDVLGGSVLFVALLVLGILAHGTAIQRFFRARAMLTQKD
ncbi:MAG TPA: CDP-alcohol phosphatidyltransferase family protein [Candidatus Binatia bacterium]|jgi:phosphatidylglycerophosphate synthase